GALELVAEFSRRPGLVVGAGTVLTVEDAKAAVRAGARFLVSPVMDEEVVRAAVDLGAVAMPGCHTPTELLRAHRAGAALQKLFPAPAGGPDYVRSVLLPMPFLRIVPTNGITAENAAAYLAAGAVAVGFVASLFSAEDLAAGRFERVEERARALLAAVRAP
ncbi:MAG TPA: bifunctional 4-hydroxy-2-oxoglutarate aldolase/2-dehydro-3-deoxy-phosphogluconate aldolase, partial [Kofleriaceae bacterium]|nr:bifunctional 4-hydroxy-2-oxoglutarate aldolase/2-dehydro-3-deoxy-phosphogluconate aldolase [Kofleriaceae bacterium]